MKRVIIPVVAAAAVLAAGATVLLTRGEEALPGLNPQPFNVTGTITVEWGYGSDPEDGGDCITDGGYSDIRTGTQVTVKDESGTVVGVGMLDPGHTQNRRCVFGFEVTGLPEGRKFYAVEVSRRGALNYSREDLKQPLAFTLGG